MKEVTIRLKNGETKKVSERIAKLYMRHGAVILSEKPREVKAKLPPEITEPVKLKEAIMKPPEIIKPILPEIPVMEVPKPEPQKEVEIKKGVMKETPKTVKKTDVPAKKKRAKKA